VALGRLDHPKRRVDPDLDGFFDDEMLAVLGRHDGVGGVAFMWSQHPDRFDVGVVAQACDAFVRASAVG